MEYREIKTLEEIVNKRGSKLWTQMNDNSKADRNRARFVQEHGGQFFKEGRYWVWKTEAHMKNGYWLKRVDTGEKVFFTSMTEFGEKNGLTPVKICELLNGKRKTYNGWTANELREVKATVAPNVKIKEEKPKKEAITKFVTLINEETKEIISIPNINQFAKMNNMDANALYKVSRGKLKSYKNLKLYNPLEGYQPSNNS